MDLYYLLIIYTSHKYLQLPLAPVEQFLADHPELAEADEATITIARINQEHAERVTLEDQRTGLLKKKQGLIADNKKRKEDLAKLDVNLELFIDVSLLSPVQDDANKLSQAARPIQKTFEKGV